MPSPLISSILSFAHLGQNRRHNVLSIYWALFCGAISFFLLRQVFGERLGIMSIPVSILGGSSCGFAWLLTHALFTPAQRREFWPKLIVMTLVFTSAISTISQLFVDQEAMLSAAFGLIHNTHNLLSSTVLVLTFMIPISGFPPKEMRPERRFRIAFMCGYLALITLSVLFDRHVVPSLSDQVGRNIKTVCALISLGLGSWAVLFRMSHPLLIKMTSPKRANLNLDGVVMHQRIKQQLEVHEIYKNPEIKVADLARLIMEPEHRVSSCISSVMGFSNFNRMINFYRLSRARAMLRDDAFKDWSILSIALECGFGSIGPFNRAFKDEVSMTPKQFRSSV